MICFYKKTKINGVHLLVQNTTIEEKDVIKENDSANSLSLVVKDNVSSFVCDQSEIDNNSQILWIDSENESLDDLFLDDHSALGNIVPINNIPHINKYLKSVNQKLDNGEYIIICMETKNTRKQRVMNRYPDFLSYPYYFFDFLVTRVFPKLYLTKKIHFLVAGGKNKVITLTEGLARLVYSGFQIEAYKEIEGLTYIVAKKNKEPIQDANPTYGAIVKLPRIGKKGEIVECYKIRTMHPYSEYLQEYMFERFGTEDGDKIENDFRKTHWGKMFRKYWIDEIPMIWNLLRGDIKLIGVRPLSKHKFDTYPEYLQKKRIKSKPGLIPPYYADLPKSPDEFFEIENRYLDRYFKNPIRTDIKYFLKSMYNIIIGGQRSR